MAELESKVPGFIQPSMTPEEARTPLEDFFVQAYKESGLALTTISFFFSAVLRSVTYCYVGKCSFWRPRPSG